MNTTGGIDLSGLLATNLEGHYTFPAPPAGFDPLVAPSATLQKYGFPARPAAAAGPEALALWQRAVSRVRTVVAPELSLAQPSRPVPALLESSGGCGAVATQGPYYDVFGQWTCPDVAIAPSESAPALIAIGIGLDVNLPSGPLAGTIQFLSGGLFGWGNANYPYFNPPSGQTLTVNNFTFNPGDSIFSSLSYWGGYLRAFASFVNLTTGQGTSILSDAAKGSEATGANAAWLVRTQPEVDGQKYSLPTYGAVSFVNVGAHVGHPGDKGKLADLSQVETVTLVGADKKSISSSTVLSPAFYCFDQRL